MSSYNRHESTKGRSLPEGRSPPGGEGDRSPRDPGNNAGNRDRDWQNTIRSTVSWDVGYRPPEYYYHHHPRDRPRDPRDELDDYGPDARDPYPRRSPIHRNAWFGNRADDRQREEEEYHRYQQEEEYHRYQQEEEYHRYRRDIRDDPSYSHGDRYLAGHPPLPNLVADPYQARRNEDNRYDAFPGMISPRGISVPARGPQVPPGHSAPHADPRAHVDSSASSPSYLRSELHQPGSAPGDRPIDRLNLSRRDQHDNFPPNPITGGFPTGPTGGRLDGLSLSRERLMYQDIIHNRDRVASGDIRRLGSGISGGGVLSGDDCLVESVRDADNIALSKPAGSNSNVSGMNTREMEIGRPHSNIEIARRRNSGQFLVRKQLSENVCDFGMQKKHLHPVSYASQGSSKDVVANVFGSSPPSSARSPGTSVCPSLTSNTVLKYEDIMRGVVDVLETHRRHRDRDHDDRDRHGDRYRGRDDEDVNHSWSREAKKQFEACDNNISSTTRSGDNYSGDKTNRRLRDNSKNTSHWTSKNTFLQWDDDDASDDSHAAGILRWLSSPARFRKQSLTSNESYEKPKQINRIFGDDGERKEVSLVEFLERKRYIQSIGKISDENTIYKLQDPRNKILRIKSSNTWDFFDVGDLMELLYTKDDYMVAVHIEKRTIQAFPSQQCTILSVPQEQIQKQEEHEIASFRSWLLASFPIGPAAIPEDSIAPDSVADGAQNEGMANNTPVTECSASSSTATSEEKRLISVYEKMISEAITDNLNNKTKNRTQSMPFMGGMNMDSTRGFHGGVLQQKSATEEAAEAVFSKEPHVDNWDQFSLSSRSSPRNMSQNGSVNATPKSGAVPNNSGGVPKFLGGAPPDGFRNTSGKGKGLISPRDGNIRGPSDNSNTRGPWDTGSSAANMSPSLFPFSMHPPPSGSNNMDNFPPATNNVVNMLREFLRVLPLDSSPKDHRSIVPSHLPSTNSQQTWDSQQAYGMAPSGMQANNSFPNMLPPSEQMQMNQNPLSNQLNASNENGTQQNSWAGLSPSGTSNTFQSPLSMSPSSDMSPGNFGSAQGSLKGDFLGGSQQNWRNTSLSYGRNPDEGHTQGSSYMRDSNSYSKENANNYYGDSYSKGSPPGNYNNSPTNAHRYRKSSSFEKEGSGTEGYSSYSGTNDTSYGRWKSVSKGDSMKGDSSKDDRLLNRGSKNNTDSRSSKNSSDTTKGNLNYSRGDSKGDLGSISPKGGASKKFSMSTESGKNDGRGSFVSADLDDLNVNEYGVPLTDDNIRGSKFLATYYIGIEPKMNTNPWDNPRNSSNMKGSKGSWRNNKGGNNVSTELTNEFDVTKRIIGLHGCIMKWIIHVVPGARIRLRGRGSGFVEKDTGRESTDSLQMHLSVGTPQGYIVVKHLLGCLLDDIDKQYHAAVDGEKDDQNGGTSALNASQQGSTALNPSTSSGLKSSGKGEKTYTLIEHPGNLIIDSNFEARFKEKYSFFFDDEKAYLPRPPGRKPS